MIRYKPLTPSRWDDLVALFGERGACGGCWCMWMRLPRAKFEAQKGSGNRRAMRRIVAAGRVPGILAYLDGQPVGWCSVGPREDYSALARSRILKPVDDTPVWSIVCFFVAREARRTGVTVGLLAEAVRHVKRKGGRVVEGYPVEPKSGSTPDTFAWHGLASAFNRAGFTECLRRSATRPIMRYVIK